VLELAQASYWKSNQKVFASPIFKAGLQLYDESHEFIASQFFLQDRIALMNNTMNGVCRQKSGGGETTFMGEQRILDMARGLQLTLSGAGLRYAG